jgi:hypothetical protein
MRLTKWWFSPWIRIPSRSLRSGTGSTLGLRPRYAKIALSATCKTNQPISTWRGGYFFIKSIVYDLLTKVDWRMSRAGRDKYPIYDRNITDDNASASPTL